MHLASLCWLFSLPGLISLHDQINAVFVPEEQETTCERAAGAIVYFYNQAAISLCTQTINRHPDRADKTYVRRGSLYNELGEEDRAMADFTQAIRINPDNVQARLERGYIYWSRGLEKKHDAVPPVINISIEIDDLLLPVDELEKKLDSLFLFLLAYSDWLTSPAVSPSDVKHDFELAFKDFGEVIRLDPNNSEAYRLRGIIGVQLENYRMAETDFTNLIRLEPNDECNYSRRSAARLRLGEFDSAIADLTEAIRCSHGYGPYSRRRGMLYAKIGDLDQAIADYTTAIRRNDDAIAYQYRGQAYLRRGEKALAEQDFAQAKKKGYSKDLAARVDSF